VTQRPLDPRKANVAIDANALDRDGTDHDKRVDRLLELRRAGAIRLIVPRGVRIEAQHPHTPAHVSEPILAQIFTLPTELTAQETDTRAGIAAALQGNAKPGKHAADAGHLSEAAKYGGYFITHDNRILTRSQGLDTLLPPSLQVVTLATFLEIFDDYEAGRRI
jgi:hypothetical protein